MSRRKRMIEELEQDIRDHIAIEMQDNIERGMTPEEARHAALRKFGNIAKVKDQTYEVWSVPGSSDCYRTYVSVFAHSERILAMRWPQYLPWRSA